jgi:drug/metabolite transporter (DMT)-like permease
LPILQPPARSRHNDRVTPPGRPAPSTAAVVLALLIVYVVWGSTYLAIAVMVQTMPPLLAAGARFGTAGLIMLAFLAARARLRRSDPAESKEPVTAVHWRSAIVIGALLLLGGNGGVVLAELRIPSGVAAVLIATVPIWLAAFDAILTRRRPSALVITGLVAGIVGVAILLVPVEGLENLDPLGVLLTVAAAFSWALGSIYARGAPLPKSGGRASAMEQLGGAAALILAGSLLGELGEIDVSTFSTASILAVAYLVVFGSIVAFTAYTWLLANVPVSTVGTYAYVNPIVAVALGSIVLSEPITPRTIIAAVIIIGAVAAMVSGRPRSAQETATVEGATGVDQPQPMTPIVRPDPES